MWKKSISLKEAEENTAEVCAEALREKETSHLKTKKGLRQMKVYLFWQV